MINVYGKENIITLLPQPGQVATSVLTIHNSILSSIEDGPSTVFILLRLEDQVQVNEYCI